MELELSEELQQMHSKLLGDLGELQAMLLRADPDMPNYLKMIHTDLAQYPELVHILTDEECNKIYAALMQQSQVQIAVKESKTKTPKAAGIKKADKGLLADGSSVADLL